MMMMIRVDSSPFESSGSRWLIPFNDDDDSGGVDDSIR